MTHPQPVPVRRRHARSADGTTIGYRSTGDGPGLIIVGGALRSSTDYEPLAATLAADFTVHLVDRRGRGDSGQQGPDYSLHREVEDLAAVQRETGATLAFGHSYGGLVVLETARARGLFRRVAGYEPGVSSRPVPTDWMIRYGERLAAGDPAGAFAAFIRGSEGAPAFLRLVPQWYLRAALWLFLRTRAGRRLVPLLPVNLTEHREYAAYHDRRAQLADLRIPVQLLVGSRTATAEEPRPFEELADLLPAAELHTLPGLDHFGPEGRGAPAVGARLRTFFRAAERTGTGAAEERL